MSYTTTKHFTCDGCGKQQDHEEGQGMRPNDWLYMAVNGDELDFCPACGDKVQYFAIKPRKIWHRSNPGAISARMDMSQMEAIVAGVDPEDVFIEGGAE